MGDAPKSWIYNTDLVLLEDEKQHHQLSLPFISLII